MRETFSKTKPVLLEPVMKIEIECPSAVPGLGGGQSDVAAAAWSSRPRSTAPTARIEGEVPLAETFGYSTDLRSMTQGQGTFTMEFARYKRLPRNLEEEVIAERKKAALAGAI